VAVRVASALERGNDEWKHEELRESVELAYQLVGGRRASLLLPIAERPELRIVAVTGLPTRIVNMTRVCPGEGIAGRVQQTWLPLLVNAAHPGIPLRASAGYATNSFSSVPVPFDRYDCGVLNVADPVLDEAFTDDHFTAMQSFAALIGRSLVARHAEHRAREAEDRTSRLHQQLIEAQELERGRLARDLHDEAGHSLATAIFRLDIEGGGGLASGRELAGRGRTRDALMQCADALYNIAFTLQPRILADLGLVPALRSLIAQVEEVGQMQIDLAIQGTSGHLATEVRLTAFRIMQEALTNVHKHTGNDHARVTLDFQPAQVVLTVEDAGVGMGPEASRGEQHAALGLRGMRERVELLGGTFVVADRCDGGTVVSAILPLTMR